VCTHRRLTPLNPSVHQVKVNHNPDTFTASFPAYRARLQYTFSPYFTDYLIKDGTARHGLGKLLEL
jgi:hypothetical protein